MLLAPVAFTASTCDSSISSIDSYNNFAQNPIDRSQIAIVPAKTPGPNMKTSINAQIRELTDREETIINNAIALTEL